MSVQREAQAIPRLSLGLLASFLSVELIATSARCNPPVVIRNANQIATDDLGRKLPAYAAAAAARGDVANWEAARSSVASSGRAPILPRGLPASQSDPAEFPRRTAPPESSGLPVLPES